MADGDDVIRKACENFSLHLKYPLTLRPEQRQAVEALLQGKDVLAHQDLFAKIQLSP